MFPFDLSYRNYTEIPAAELLEKLQGVELKVTAACKVIAAIDALARLALETPSERMGFGLNFMENSVKITAFLDRFDTLGLVEEHPVMTLKGVADGDFKYEDGDDGGCVVTLKVPR
ncbi:hypothetical protein [Actinomadura coerulea]|uniref:hypothetical protein n=1 Tax=Actinomadura coerulea TaxID=46159 RepID=UPI00343F8283